MKVRKGNSTNRPDDELKDLVPIPQLAGALMCFAVQRGKQLWAAVQTGFGGEPNSTIRAGSRPVLLSEFRQILPDFPPVHKAECPPEFSKWAPHWDDIRKLAASFKTCNPARLTQRKKQDWSSQGKGTIALAKAFPLWIRKIDKALQDAMADVGMDVLSIHATCPTRFRGAVGLPHASVWDLRKADILKRVFSQDACMSKHGHSLEEIANTYWAMWLSTELDRFKKKRNRALENMGKIRVELGTRLHDPEFYNLPADDVVDALGQESVSVPQLRALVKKLKDYKVAMRFVAQPEDDDDEDKDEETPYGDEEQDNDEEEMPNTDLAAAQERLTRAEVEEAEKPENQRIVEWADLAMGSIIGVMETKSRRRIVMPKQKGTFTKSARRGRDRGRVTAAQLKLVATEAEIAAFAAELSDHLKEWDRSARVGELPDFEDIWLGDRTLADDFFRNMDTGTEAFAKKTPQELDQILGWTGSGLPAAFVKKHGDDTLVEVMWHQKTALASILTRAFEPTEPPIDDRAWGKAPGMILTDAVGTGKTIVALALIASLIQLRGIETEGLTKPPVMNTAQGTTQFCGRSGGIPDAPHLIVAPGTILDQWISEAHRFFKPGAVEIIKVDAQGSKWENALLRLDDGSYPDIQKVVFVQHSTVNTMGARTLLPIGINDLVPLGITEAGRKTTLFGRHFASIWIDEAHEYRTGQKQFRNCNTLINCALLKTLATATPLKQHARDVFYLGVLARMPLVMQSEIQQFLRAILADLARVKQRAGKTSIALAPNGVVCLDTTDIEITPHHKFATHVVHVLRQASLPRTIRRTTESLRWDGKRIGDELPQNVFTYVMVPMTEEEIRAAGVYTNAANVNFDTTNENFFFEPRRTISFPGKAAHNKYTEHEFHTKEDWMTSTHSKMTALIEITKKVLVKGGDILPEDKRGGGRETEQVVELAELGLGNLPPYTPYPDPGLYSPDVDDIKVVIHTEWTMHHPLIVSALRLAGIKSLALTGNVPANRRQQVVDQFRNDRSIRVLLMSDVGAEGLNLNFVTCMIIYDVGWTAVQTTQLKGRLHRKGQTKPTFVFQLVGRDTLDSTMIMSGILKNSLLSEYLMRDAKTALAEYRIVKLIGTNDDAELVRSSYGFDNSALSDVESLLGNRKRSEKDKYPTAQPELARLYVPPQQDRRLLITALPLSGDAGGAASTSGTTHTGMTPPPPSPRRTPPPPIEEELSRPGSPMAIEDRAPSQCSSQDDADSVERLLTTIPRDISNAPDDLSQNIQDMLLQDGPPSSNGEAATMKRERSESGGFQPAHKRARTKPTPNNACKGNPPQGSPPFRKPKVEMDDKSSLNWNLPANPASSLQKKVKLEMCDSALPAYKEKTHLSGCRIPTDTR